MNINSVSLSPSFFLPQTEEPNLETLLQKLLENPEELNASIKEYSVISPDQYLVLLFSSYNNHENAIPLLKLIVKEYFAHENVLDLISSDPNCFIWLLEHADPDDLGKLFNSMNTDDDQTWGFIYGIIFDLMKKMSENEMTKAQVISCLNRLFVSLPFHCVKEIESLIKEFCRNYSDQEILILIESIAEKNSLTEHEQMILEQILSTLEDLLEQEDESDQIKFKLVLKNVRNMPSRTAQHVISSLNPVQERYLAEYFQDDYPAIVSWLEDLFCLFPQLEKRERYFHLLTRFVSQPSFRQLTNACYENLMDNMAIDCSELNTQQIVQCLDLVPKRELARSFYALSQSSKKKFVQDLKSKYLPEAVESHLNSLLKNLHVKKENEIFQLLNSLDNNDLAHLLKTLSDKSQLNDLMNFFRKFSGQSLLKCASIFRSLTWATYLPYLLTFDSDLTTHFCCSEIELLDDENEEEYMQEIAQRTNLFYLFFNLPDCDLVLERVKQDSVLLNQLYTNMFIIHSKIGEGYAHLNDICTYLGSFLDDEQFMNNGEFFAFMDEIPPFLVGVSAIFNPQLFFSILPHLSNEQIVFIIKALPIEYMREIPELTLKLQRDKIQTIFKSLSSEQLESYLTNKTSKLKDILKDYQNTQEKLYQLKGQNPENKNSNARDVEQAKEDISRLTGYSRRIEEHEKDLSKWVKKYAPTYSKFKSECKQIEQLIKEIKKFSDKFLEWKSKSLKEESKSCSLAFGQMTIGKQEAEEYLTDALWFWEFLTIKELRNLGLKDGQELMQIGIQTIQDLNLLGITKQKHKTDKIYVLGVLAKYCCQQNLKGVWIKLNEMKCPNLTTLEQKKWIQPKDFFTLNSAVKEFVHTSPSQTLKKPRDK